MKFKFTIETESIEDMDVFTKAHDVFCALRKADNRLRSYEKYEDPSLEGAQKAIEETRTILNSIDI